MHAFYKNNIVSIYQNSIVFDIKKLLVPNTSVTSLYYNYVTYNIYIANLATKQDTIIIYNLLLIVLT